jgi:uncharacterized protein HemY
MSTLPISILVLLSTIALASVIFVLLLMVWHIVTTLPDTEPWQRGRHRGVVMRQYTETERPLWDTSSLHDVELALRRTNEQVCALRCQMARVADSTEEVANTAQTMLVLDVIDHFAKD